MICGESSGQISDLAATRPAGSPPFPSRRPGCLVDSRHPMPGAGPDPDGGPAPSAPSAERHCAHSVTFRIPGIGCHSATSETEPRMWAAWSRQVLRKPFPGTAITPTALMRLASRCQRPSPHSYTGSHVSPLFCTCRSQIRRHEESRLVCSAGSTGRVPICGWHIASGRRSRS